MNPSPELTIIMPCLNEAKSVAFCVREALGYIESRGIPAEVLVVDNGSTDDSPVLAREAGARVVSVTEKGYGNAILGGIRAAEGKYIIMGDCDGSYDFSDLDPLLTHLRQGCSLVVGNRFLGGIEPGAMPLTHRYFGVPLLSFLGRLRYGVKLGDFHCGLRGFSRQQALSLGLRCPGMEFATELIGRFAASGGQIREVPVKLRRDLRQRPSHLRSIPDGLRHLKLIFSKLIQS